MTVCMLCSQELTVALDPEELNGATSSAAGGSPQVVPDDVCLSCGHHFHWQCLLDESPRLASSLACPSCSLSISSLAAEPTSQPHVFVRYHNEGGIQDRLDIFALIVEEAYLDANPAARPARAFLTLCSEGDVGGIVEMVHAIQEADEGGMAPADILRYQDPLDKMSTGLHVAVAKSQGSETIFLLLWLASELSTAEFPEDLSQAAIAMGAGRETAQAGPDIRTIRDAQGRTAGDIASAMGDHRWAGVLY